MLGGKLPSTPIGTSLIWLIEWIKWPKGRLKIQNECHTLFQLRKREKIVWIFNFFVGHFAYFSGRKWTKIRKTEKHQHPSEARAKISIFVFWKFKSLIKSEWDFFPNFEKCMTFEGILLQMYDFVWHVWQFWQMYDLVWHVWLLDTLYK